ncbi:YXWGXW repeat-containing protein [Pseudomonas yamanorum]|uniref:YXWGXW repeat-containing protein n=1 Tax=Pseudomonas yamanorum TaxID=515393 RepID=UPI0015A2AF86|nr:YXWGXW repeat-containing protein [Pseudomonas yamanorum]NWD23897.1 YXWGXW repeat-containing protein [Pseudomonas yamanorum]
MLLRYAALAALVVAASGCVEERVVHDRRPVQREYVEVVAPQPPPLQVIEVEPEGRPGYLWSRGYWRWEGGRYVAVHGHWEPERPGYRYVHPHWVQRNDGYHWQGGGWVR